MNVLYDVLSLSPKIDIIAYLHDFTSRDLVLKCWTMLGHVCTMLETVELFWTTFEDVGPCLEMLGQCWTMLGPCLTMLYHVWTRDACVVSRPWRVLSALC